MSQTAFSLPVRLDAVDDLVVTLKAGAEAALPDDRLMAMEIALTEALTNTVRHGCAELPGATITVTLAIDPEAVSVLIEDDGRPAPAGLFDAGPALDDIDLMAESGRGIALILACSDGVDYRHEAGRNRLSLRFLREGAA